jgi:hypothetical protein
VIPTQYKSKLSKTLSWPVGAQTVTDGLGDAPHAAECTLWFCGSPVDRASEFQRMLREARPYAVLVAEYRPEIRMPYTRSKAMEDQGLYEARWEIHINPVPRAWRANVGTLLRERGFPAVSAWLRSFRGDGWQAQYHRLELVFAPTEGTLSQRTSNGLRRDLKR